MRLSYHLINLSYRCALNWRLRNGYEPCVNIELSGGRWRDEMEKFYKNHRIEVSASLDGDCWSVSLFIYYQEEATNILVTFSLNESFTSYNGAVEAGLAAAQNWIDWRKPTN